MQLYQHSWKLGKRDIVWKHDAHRAKCFHTFSSFHNYHELRVDIIKDIARWREDMNIIFEYVVKTI